MTYMLDGEVRCRECGHIGFPGALETWGRGAPYLSVNGVPTYAVDCCDRCLSENVSELPACVRCEHNDATDDDYCHTCAIAIDTDDLLVESRAGLDRISDLHQTILDCARGLR